MTPALRLWPKAALDILAATRWYDGQRLGLGDEFLADLSLSLQQICDSPASYARVLHTTRRALLARFPYAIYFRVRPQAVDVIALIHMRRHPRWWQAREASSGYRAVPRAA